MTSDIPQIAARLTSARKRLILELPVDGSAGEVTNRAVAKRLFWHFYPVLVLHKHCPQDRKEWLLTPLGLAVSQYLRSHDNG